MNLEHSNKTKRPIGAERPFPWRCRHCGKHEVFPACVSYDAEVGHNGTIHTITIASIEIPICRSCGQKVFTEKVDAQINAALEAQLRTLPPQGLPNTGNKRS